VSVPTRAFGYVRLSKETEETTSPERQRRAIRRLCSDRGWDLVELFEDIDVSAYNGNARPAFSRMMGRLADTDAIVFWKLDRLSRSSVEAGQIAEACKAANVDIVATDMALDTTSAGGKFVYTVMAAAGEMESARISERSRAMMAFKRERDEWVGRVPFGWRLVGKHLEQDPAQQAVLAEAARRYVAGESFSAIAHDLGLGTAPMIRMLRSERVQDALPAEVSGPLVEALVVRKMQRVPTSRQSLLGGIARCGVCGLGASVSSTRARRAGRWLQYRCHTTGHAGISARWLDEFVTNEVLEAIDTGKLLDAIRRRRKPARSRKASELEARLELLDQMFTEGKMTRARFERVNGQLLEQLAKAQDVERSNGVDIPEELARNLGERWDGFTIQTKRRIIGAVIESINIAKARAGHGPITPDRVQIVWRT
jgi:DNA invertase Pin-like site-specific DNA recombinase